MLHLCLDSITTKPQSVIATDSLPCAGSVLGPGTHKHWPEISFSVLWNFVQSFAVSYFSFIPKVARTLQKARRKNVTP